MKKIITLAILGMALAVAGCTTSGESGRRTHNTVVGGAIGGAVGCGIGSFWGACGPGAAIGATGGAVLGGSIPAGAGGPPPAEPRVVYAKPQKAKRPAQ